MEVLFFKLITVSIDKVDNSEQNEMKDPLETLGTIG